MALYIPHSIFHLARLSYVRPETFGPHYVILKNKTSRADICVSHSSIMICSLSCLHNKNTRTVKWEHVFLRIKLFDISMKYQNTINVIKIKYVCNCIHVQQYRNWVLKVTRSLFLVSDGASISRAVSTLLPKPFVSEQFANTNPSVTNFKWTKRYWSVLLQFALTNPPQ